MGLSQEIDSRRSSDRGGGVMERASFLSPLEGEMSPKATEGVISEGTARTPSAAVRTPPGRFAATLPSRGRGTPGVSERRPAPVRYSQSSVR